MRISINSAGLVQDCSSTTNSSIEIKGIEMWNKAATLMKLLLLVGCLTIYSVSATWEESTIEDIFLHDAGLTLTSEELEGEIHRIDNSM